MDFDKDERKFFGFALILWGVSAIVGLAFWIAIIWFAVWAIGRYIL